MDTTSTPALFGLDNTNRDFSNKDDWGKNVFNNAFPAALLCYMQSRQIPPVYLAVSSEGTVKPKYIDASEVLGGDYENIFFMFESAYPPYSSFVSTTLPRTDLVTHRLNPDNTPGDSLQDIEIKLTAVPDHTTSNLSQELQGPEIVVRPDTIVYLAMSIIRRYQDNRGELAAILEHAGSQIQDWNSTEEIIPNISSLARVLRSFMTADPAQQEPILIQPIWRTRGKSLELDDNAFDMFVWSNFAFAIFFIDQAVRTVNGTRVNRFQRSVVWLFKMLYDYAQDGYVSHSEVIRNINFGSQTDKAFAASGRLTNRYLISNELLSPRIRKDELSNIILNEGYMLLSPERRFDAAVISNISLFNR